MVLFGFGKKENEIAADRVSVHMESVSVSETGLVCADNQDRIYVDDIRGVYCVADGVGGGEEGAMASEIVCRNVKMYVGGAGNGFKAVLQAVQTALEESNAAIREYAVSKGYTTMASTVAIVVFDPAKPRHAAVCHIGDSRVYRISHGMPQILTRDHRNEKGDNRLLRAVGSDDRLRAEWLEVNGDSAARYVICTDGVHDLVSPGRIAAFTAPGTLGEAARRLEADVLRHGAVDNYSFIIVQA